jgi:hypothetical protein
LTLLCTCCAFLGLGDVECFHCDDCTFVSGSYPYTHVSSPVITVFRNSALQHIPCDLKAEPLLLLWKQVVHRFHHHSAHVQIFCYNWVCRALSAISWTVKQGSSRIRERTFSMTFAFRLVDGLSEHWSLSTAAPHVQSYWVKCNALSTYYSIAHTSCLGEKDAPGEAAKNYASAWRSPLTTVIRFANLPSLIFLRKNKVRYFLDSPRRRN